LNTFSQNKNTVEPYHTLAFTFLAFTQVQH